MKTLYQSYNLSVSKAYIINIPTNSISVDLSNRCLDSCMKVGMPAELYTGFDGTSGLDIKAPSHLENQQWIKWLKVTDHFQSVAEIACSLSHISLWVKCMTEDQPLVILEHDAIMIKPYLQHEIYNGIVYLGSKDELKLNITDRNGILPNLRSINKNWNFINKAHAYSIDPASARKLFINVLDRGIYESADVMIKSDDIAIIQTGFYAYELPGETLIKTRK